MEITLNWGEIAGGMGDATIVRGAILSGKLYAVLSLQLFETTHNNFISNIGFNFHQKSYIRLTFKWF